MRGVKQPAKEETDGRTWPGRAERRAARRRSNRLAGHPRQIKTEMESGEPQDSWVLRQYAGNGSYSKMRLTTVRETSSCAPKSQLRHRGQKIHMMITDAAIIEATNEVDKAEQELRSLSEALDNMKVRTLIRKLNKQVLINISFRRHSTLRGGTVTAYRTV